MAEAVPTWMSQFLKPARLKPSDYFTRCKEHNYGDRKYYCVDCGKGPLCRTGRKVDHGGHMVLQVRKASSLEAVCIEDIKTLVNIEHIQKFSINGHDVVFLPRRPQDGLRRSSPANCQGCGRGLRDGRFCSLSCKFLTLPPLCVGDGKAILAANTILEINRLSLINLELKNLELNRLYLINIEKLGRDANLELNPMSLINSSACSSSRGSSMINSLACSSSSALSSSSFSSGP